jgi:hypothetical protein
MPRDSFGRFCSKLEFICDNGCDLPCAVWTGARDRKGYGQAGRGGRTQRAHAVAWTWAHGAPPAGMVIYHLCHNPACVRLSHMQLVTPAEHALLHAKSVCRNGHVRSDENIYTYLHKDGFRRRACIPCRQAHDRAHGPEYRRRRRERERARAMGGAA